MATPNMRQIAEAAGVSKSAVSLALRDDPRMAKSTRERIRRIADELGYKKNNLVATLMAQLRSPDKVRFQGNLALLNCSEHQKLFEWNTFRDFKVGIAQRADQLGYGLEEFWVRQSGLKPERLVQILRARSIEGVIFGAVLKPEDILPGGLELWREFSLAVVGMRSPIPGVPCSMNNHFQTVQFALRRVLELGYRRPALVIERSIDNLLERRFSGGFVTLIEDLPEADRLRPYWFSRERAGEFMEWFDRHRPDVILCLHEELPHWLRDRGIQVGEDVALVHLDRDPKHAEWAGMEQNNLLVGSAAADVCINQIHRREFGLREHPKLVLIDSDWVDGPYCPGRKGASGGERRRRSRGGAPVTAA
jgi:LacI family transcriptional regulator